MHVRRVLIVPGWLFWLVRSSRLSYNCQTDRHSYIIEPRPVFGLVVLMSTVSCYWFPPPSVRVQLDVSGEETGSLVNKQTKTQRNSICSPTVQCWYPTSCPVKWSSLSGLEKENLILFVIYLQRISWWFAASSEAKNGQFGPREVEEERVHPLESRNREQIVEYQHWTLQRSFRQLNKNSQNFMSIIRTFQ